MDADVVLDGGIGGFCPASTGFMLNTKYLFYRPHAQRDMVPLSPGKRYSVNQDAEVQILAWAGNLTSSGLQFQGRMRRLRFVGGSAVSAPLAVFQSVHPLYQPQQEKIMAVAGANIANAAGRPDYGWLHPWTSRCHPRPHRCVCRSPDRDPVRSGNQLHWLQQRCEVQDQRAWSGQHRRRRIAPQPDWQCPNNDNDALGTAAQWRTVGSCSRHHR